MEKTIFWNVDTQKDFMEKDGALYVQGAEQIKHNLKKITDYARDKNIKVVNTGDYHTSVSKEISKHPDFKTTFPDHCMAGTEGTEFIEETSPTKIKEDNYVIINWTDDDFPVEKVRGFRNIILHKDNFNVFEGNPWALNILATLWPETVVVYGVATNVCVDHAINGLLEEDCKVIVVKDAIKELPGCDVEAILKGWQDKGVTLISTNKLINKK